MSFLDEAICVQFRDVINSTDFFLKDPEYKGKYNLLCSVMDRVDSCVEYLNKNDTPPKEEVDVLVFVMYVAILRDAVMELQGILKFDYPYNAKLKNGERNEEAYRFFLAVCMGDTLGLEKKLSPTDDKFFEYFRSLTMAHPFGTDRPKFFEKGEIQYSPWVISNDNIHSKMFDTDEIGVRIYSTHFSEIKDLKISFEVLKSYVSSRYALIKEAIKSVKEIILNEENKWRLDKVIVSEDVKTTFESFARVWEKRYVDTWELQLVVSILEFEPTSERNKLLSDKYKSALGSLIPRLVNETGNLNYEKFILILREVFKVRPEQMHTGASYELSKVCGYQEVDRVALDVDPFVLELGKNFYDKLACRWVFVDFDKYKWGEVQMLFEIACFEESQRIDQNS